MGEAQVEKNKAESLPASELKLKYLEAISKKYDQAYHANSEYLTSNICKRQYLRYLQLIIDSQKN